MSSNGQRVIFQDLFGPETGICIPLIQRDYAQGRADSVDVRNDFLAALLGAFKLPADSAELPLNLDFVYGGLDEDLQFQPLDGQQRLTTLFLLHWYLAQRDGQSENFQGMFCHKGKSRFSYKVRPSSTEFFDALSQFSPQRVICGAESLVELICDQPWYFRRWRLDPTIQSALVMLEAIHATFQDAPTATFARLCDSERPVITFQLLDLKAFGLADDLYIKMNSRGMPLTPFETFKARYEQTLQHQYDGQIRTVDGVKQGVASFIATRLDTRWADLFWTTCNEGEASEGLISMQLFDDAMMNVLRVVALATRDLDSPGYAANFNTLRASKWSNTFHTFDDNGWLDKAFSDTVVLLFEAWSSNAAGFCTLIPDTRYFNDREFFKAACTDPFKLSYTQLVQFAGYVQFVATHGDKQPHALEQWMRLVCNLSSNTAYVRPEDAQRSLRGLRDMLPDALDILPFLVDARRPITGFNGAQTSEEVIKANLLLSGAIWREPLEKAELHGYFQGQIGFLLERSGLAIAVRASPKELSDHSALKQPFSDALRMAEAMFDAQGLITIDKAFSWERALLSLGDYFLVNGSNYSFLVNAATEQGSWKRLLGEDSERRKLLFTLWDQLDIEESLAPQLHAIIEQAEPDSHWQQLLVQTPNAFAYCRKRQIRFVGGDTDDIYLLARERMSGSHAELHTFALHDRLSRNSPAELAALALQSYESVSGDAEQPYFHFHHEKHGQSLHVYVSHESQRFLIQVDRSELEGRATLLEALVCAAGFEMEEDYFSVRCEFSLIDEKLAAVAQVLAAD
ncbi:MAG: GmrSD restriction endonuclease domain-containing protein [Pseudomonas sp.]